MGSYFKITVNLPVGATMGQFSLIMPRFFVCFSLKDIILWLGFYGLKKPFLKKLLMIFVKNPLWLKKFTLMFKKCGNNFTNGGRKMRMATTVCEYCFVFLSKFILDENNEEI